MGVEFCPVARDGLCLFASAAYAICTHYSGWAERFEEVAEALMANIMVYAADLEAKSHHARAVLECWPKAGDAVRRFRWRKDGADFLVPLVAATLGAAIHLRRFDGDTVSDEGTVRAETWTEKEGKGRG